MVNSNLWKKLNAEEKSIAAQIARIAKGAMITADPIHKCFGVSSLLIFHILGRIFEKITRTTMAIINAICVTESK